MEKEICNICYIRTEKDISSQESRKIYMLKRTLPYHGGCVRLFYGIIGAKEIPVRKVNRHGKETGAYLRKKRKFYKTLEMLAIKAQSLVAEAEMFFVPCAELKAYMKQEEDLPMPLFAICLKKEREKVFSPKKICLSLPKETGEIKMQEILWMLSPYLSKINEFIICGEETACAAMIENFLYGEYGILTSYAGKPAKNTLWLDFGGDGGDFLSVYAAENGIYHLNHAEVVKLLDTITKNGYNTGVN